MMKNSMVLNIIAKREAGLWVGHCLELDVVATAGDLQGLKREMFDLIVAQVEYAFGNNNLDHLFRPAPGEVWEAFYRCVDSVEDRIDLSAPLSAGGAKSFVPPWVIANTCFSGDRWVA